MKIGIALLVIGVLLLVLSIPFSIALIIVGFTQITRGYITGGILSYAPIIGVILGFVTITIGATRVFKR